MKKILVIGGGAYQIPLIKRILENGDQAYCVDANPNAAGLQVATAGRVIDVLDKDACLKYAESLGIDAVMTYGATITLPTVAYIGKRLQLPALPEATAELSKSKYAIKKRLAEHGCNIQGDFFEMTSPKDADDHVFTYPCVIKPSDGSGSKGVCVVNDASELNAAVEFAFANARFGSVYKEDMIRGEEYTVEAYVCNGTTHVYAIIKTTFEKTADGEIVYGHRTPSGLPAEAESRISAEIKQAIAALDITMGSVNFDVILSEDDGKPYIIDCGIRIGQNLIASHIVPYARGVNVLDNTIRLALGETVDAEPKENRCIATRLLIYHPGTITEIRDMSGLIGTNGIRDVVMRKTVGDVQREYQDKSDTCGWVITEGNTPDEAEALAGKAKHMLEEYIVITPIGKESTVDEGKKPELLRGRGKASV